MNMIEDFDKISFAYDSPGAKSPFAKLLWLLFYNHIKALRAYLEVQYGSLNFCTLIRYDAIEEFNVESKPEYLA